jgi:DNA-binding SARP family transcriptional activator
MTGARSVTAAVVRGRVRAPLAAGLRRGRVIAPLVGPETPRLTLLVAPPGSGKSTLLAHVAEAAGTSGDMVAWLTLDTAVTDEVAFLRHLRAAFGRVVEGLADDWPTADEALADLEETLTARVLLVIDDVHTVDTEPAAEVIALLVRYQPELLRIALGSRTVPDIEMSRLRLAGAAVEIDADVLRFRTWEVEELFRQCHGVRLPAAEVTTLTQRTGGWAAGLQLFHLATHRQPPSSRAALLSAPGTGGRLSRDYLARHVLDRIDADLQDFLVRTSVLDELTAGRCNALLGTADAATRLSELDRTGLFTSVDGDADGEDRVYRYHEVLRTHLLDELSARLGAEHARTLHRRAAGLLQADGAIAAAIRSYCRAQDWDDVRQVLAVGGAALADDTGSWIDALPAAIRDRDPWVLLALARRLVGEGVLDQAAATYQRALERFATQGGGAAAAEELALLQAWREPALGVVTDWIHVARAALTDPKEQLRTTAAASIPHELAIGVAHLVTGNLAAANEAFSTAANSGVLAGPGEAVALIGRALSLTLAGDAGADAARDEAVAAARSNATPSLARLAHGLAAVAAGDAEAGTVEHLIGVCDQIGDRWGGALLRLFAGLGAVVADRPAVTLLEAAEWEFQRLSAPALACWASAGAAVGAARTGQPYPTERLNEIERATRAVGPAPYAIALFGIAAGMSEARQAERTLALARRLADRSGLPWPDAALPELEAAPSDPAATADGYDEPAPLLAPVIELPPADVSVLPRAAPPAVRIRLLGGFAIEVGGSIVDTEAIRPMHRALLRALCLHADRVVHRDRLLEWFWAGRDPDRSQHSLQVAISELRRLLEPTAARGEWTLLRREATGYRIALDSPADCDVRLIESHLRAAEAAARAGATDAMLVGLTAALGTYSGELLPEDGPADWVVEERDRLHDTLAAAAERLAEVRAAGGQQVEAVQAAQLGLQHDRYRDRLWQLLIASLSAAGHPAAAASARTAYDEVLAEMGVPPAATPAVASRAGRLSAQAN